MSDLAALGTGFGKSRRRLGAHSLERIEKNNQGASGWRVFAGDLGYDLGHFRTKAEAKDALDTWHYFHPEEQAQRDQAWVHEFIQSMRFALEEGLAEEWLDRLAKRWDLA